jgi:hypothetical protein
MKARQRKQCIAGLAMAMAVAAMGDVKAQQSTAGTATGAGSTFADIRAPQSLGTNPGALSPFSPSLQRPLGGAFSPFGFQPLGVLGGGAAPFGFTPMTPFAADIRAPQGFGFNPGTPFTPNIRQPLSGTFNAAGTLPFVTGSGVNGLAADPSFVNGGVNSFGGGSPFFFGPSGIYWTPNGQAVTPVPVPVAVPVPVPVQPGETAQPQRRRLRLMPTPERRSLQAAERVMARTALTEGTVVSADSRNVKVRVASKVSTYPRAQVFFFTNGGEMRSAAVQTKGITRGSRVLVPSSLTSN